MRGEVIKHERRRHDEAPGEIQLSRRRARPPPAGGVAQGDFADADAKMGGVARDGGLKIAARLAHQKSWIRRAMKQASEFTQSSGSVLVPKESSTDWIQTTPRSAGRWSILCGTPRNGSKAPGSRRSVSGDRRSLEPIQGACFSAKRFASMSFARAGIVSTNPASPREISI